MPPNITTLPRIESNTMACHRRRVGLVLGLIDPSGGRIRFNGQDLASHSAAERQAFRANGF